jgi:phage replication O-like protein O
MFQKPNYSQIPNEFFDKMIPILKEGEMRVLLIIMRQTFGWKKEWDRISISQLMKKTGMERMAVLRSVNSLIENNIVRKHKEGNPGEERVSYHLIVENENEEHVDSSIDEEKDRELERNSNNSYQYPKDTPSDNSIKFDQYPKDTPSDNSIKFDQYPKDTPPSILRIPTKETLTKEIKKEMCKDKVEIKTPEQENTQQSLKKKYGDIVELLEEEYLALKKEFGEKMLELKILQMNNHCKNKNITYRDYFNELRIWLLKDTLDRDERDPQTENTQQPISSIKEKIKQTFEDLKILHHIVINDALNLFEVRVYHPKFPQKIVDRKHFYFDDTYLFYNVKSWFFERGLEVAWPSGW